MVGDTSAEGIDLTAGVADLDAIDDTEGSTNVARSFSDTQTQSSRTKQTATDRTEKQQPWGW